MMDTFEVKIGSTSLETAEIAKLSRQLQTELAHLEGVAEVEPLKTEDVPTGSKVFDVVSFDAFMVGSAANVAASLLIYLVSWARNRRAQRNEVVKFEINRGNKRIVITSDTLDAEIAAWLDTLKQGIVTQG